MPRSSIWDSVLIQANEIKSMFPCQDFNGEKEEKEDFLHLSLFPPEASFSQEGQAGRWGSPVL